MKILSLKEAEELKKLIYPDGGYDSAIHRAKWLYHVREIYEHGYIVCQNEEGNE